MKEKSANYLIIVCGYEGIESIIGLFNKEDAVNKITKLRKSPHGKHIKPEQYCVQSVNEKGAKCVCNKLKVNPSRHWLY
jgi:hypothetical protein